MIKLIEMLDKKIKKTKIKVQIKCKEKILSKLQLLLKSQIIKVQRQKSKIQVTITQEQKKQVFSKIIQKKKKNTKKELLIMILIVINKIIMENKKGGPKTDEGKEISKMNALKHGLLSKEVLIAGEDEEELLLLTKKIRSEIKPETEIERLLTDRIVGNIWRLKRALGMEDGEVVSSSGGLMYDSDRFFRYETMLEKSLYKALHELERTQAKRNGKDVPLPAVVDINLDSSFGKNKLQ